jgi:hypothetical protein
MHDKRISSLLLRAVLAFFPISLATAEPPSLFKGSTFCILEENDIFRSDQQYTQGLKLSLITADDREIERTDWLPVLKKEGYTRNFGLHLGHHIYTPDNIETPDLLPKDRPYAGWLYMGVSMERRNETQDDALELDVGVVGPSSLAEDIQTRWHTVINSPIPQGWDNQLHDEPGFALSYLRRWKEVNRPYGKFHLQFFPHIGGTVGNVLTQVNGGGTVRFGRLPDDFGAVISGPMVVQYGDRWPKERNWMCHVFVGADGRAVGHNIFLDGNTYQASHEVSKNYFVSELTYGVTVQYRRFELTFTQFLRSPEYRGRDVQHEFGSVLLSWTF